MGQWLTIEFVLGLLLVTSFTSVGMVALWAATSPRHWFLRTAVVVAFLSPLLFVPAFELFVAFILQASVIASGTLIARSWQTQRRQYPERKWRQTLRVGRFPAIQFSLTTMLLFTILAAVGVWLFTRLPTLNLAAWQSVTLDGVVAGLASLVGGWMFASKRKLVIWPCGIVLAALLASPPAWFDWFGLSISMWECGWPPTNSLGGIVPLQIDRPVKLWFMVVPLVALNPAVLMTCWCAGFGVVQRDAVIARPFRQWTRRRLGKAVVIILIAIVGAFPLAILVKLLTPQSVPQVTLPNPNGFDDFIAAGNMIQSPILDFSVEPKSTDELAAEIAKFQAAFDRIGLGLSRPCQAPVWPKNGDLNKWNSTPDSIKCVRIDAKALSRAAELAELQRRFDDSALTALDCIRLGQACTRGGLLVDDLVGIACESIGDAALYPSIKELDARTCRELVVALQNVDEHRESLDDVRRRERIWDENAYGWHGYLTNLLGDASGTYGDNYRLVENTVLPRKQAITRLLILELAVRCYQLAHDRLPQKLEQLVPNILAQLPTDPFDRNNRPLSFLRTADGYVLYSVGPNGVDDGGTACAKDDNPGMPETGDLRIDTYSAEIDENKNQLPDENSNDSNNSDDAHSTANGGDK